MSDKIPYTLEDLIRLEQDGRFDDFIATLTDPEEIRQLLNVALTARDQARKANQLNYYMPVSARALQIHLATEKEVVVTGGNRSSKTDSILADTIISMTGIVPLCFQKESPSYICDYPREKIQCPMRVRIVCESLTNTWEPVIKPKLQWDKWNGRGEPGGRFGHWGWIPRSFLFKGSWDESWSEKNRVLTLTCGCTIRIMSYDQDIGDFGGASVHRVIHDEPPPNDIYRENRMRTIDTGGQIYSGFTPSDDPGRALRGSWIYELYEKGLDGPAKDPDVKAITLYTEENKILDPAELYKIAKGLTATELEVRFRGGFMHLSGKIYPMYTDVARWWCFKCNNLSLAVKSDSGKELCATCAADQITEYINFIEPDTRWYDQPVVFLLDPHPRKPNMMAWVAIDPLDDNCLIHNLEVDGEPTDVRDRVLDFERSRSLFVAARLVDPNMAQSPAHSAGRRHITVRDEFDAVGIRCALADDNFQVGMKKLRALVKPDPRTREPRMKIFNTCHLPNKQMKTYVWSEWTAQGNAEKDAKGTPRAKDDDYPTLLRYFANQEYRYSSLRAGLQPIRAIRREDTAHG